MHKSRAEEFFGKMTNSDSEKFKEGDSDSSKNSNSYIKFAKILHLTRFLKRGNIIAYINCIIIEIY